MGSWALNPTQNTMSHPSDVLFERMREKIDVKVVWAESRQKGEVEFSSELPIVSLTPRDRVALQRIALGQVINKSQSLFTPCTEVTYNGISLLHETQVLEEECPA
jgi:hypothetical protein